MGGDADFVIDVLDVVIYGFLGDDEHPCYLLNRVAACQLPRIATATARVVRADNAD